ncbi:rod shape-determining protein MreC [Paenibacillus polymyxa]|nr:MULTISPECIES: rod shape-determining protein MreC [Paenibacillus]MEB4784722.1 rod shape-determining protein MreC [Paenibacillus jamilae]MBZ6445608.1 rod shape-determining protein MreC [Paenibacillus polymyxa]MBZ6450100.1 rod shape-determining protein MreC [Paenibacillus polymyxa]MCC3260757.1 rod shape-determining protein MreC [Paenibacillus polymyxa]MCJ1221529.1 rod shape-determining protein MreC [Paenibacillus polymyxa]
MFKLFGNKRLFVLLIGIVLFIALMGITLGQRSSLTWPEKFARDSIGFVQGIFYRPASAIAGFFEDIGNMRSIYEENERLKIAVAKLTRDQIQTHNYVETNARLQNELKFTQTQKAKNNYDYRVAQVNSVSNDSKTLVIDIGEKDGAKVGQEVSSLEGFVGVISRTGNFTSTVTLLTTLDPKNPNSYAIAATVLGKENQSFGMIESYDPGTNRFQMTRIEEKDPIAKGDQIITSGAGGKFRKNLMIGTVEKIQVGEFGKTRTAIIKPAASFVDWKELLVLYTPEVPE